MVGKAPCGRRIGGGQQQHLASLGLGLGCHLGHVAAAIGQCLDLVQGGGRVAGDVGMQQRGDGGVVGQAHRLAHRLERDPVAGVGQCLVQQGLGVAHAAIGQAGDQGQRIRLRLRALGSDDAGQLADDGIGRDADGSRSAGCG